MHADVFTDSEVSSFEVDLDLTIPRGFSTEVPFGTLFSLIDGIVGESVLASDMTTSFAEPVEEPESVEDTDSIDDLRLAESSLLHDIVTLILIVGYNVIVQNLKDGNISVHQLKRETKLAFAKNRLMVCKNTISEYR